MASKRQIFRVGTHTPTKGPAIQFTEQMLRDACAAYDPSLHQAPVVIGHPKMDDPAYGWIKSLEFSDDGYVIAEEEQLEPQFAELREAGRYKKVSASWYLPDAPSNPKPGSLYLKHVGYLGAAAPAVKGLRTANFAASEEGTVEFGDWADSQVASILRRVREFFIEKFSLDDADKVLPDWELKSLEEAARATTQTNLSYTEPTESDPMTKEELAAKLQEIQAREAALATREATFTERETRISAHEAAQRLQVLVAFAEELIKAGQLLPASKDQFVAFCAQINEAGVVEFGEGDSKQSQPSLDWFKSFMKSQPKVVEFREIASDKSDLDLVDGEDGAAIAKKAVEFQESERKAGREIDVVTAVAHVMKTHAQQ
ncbi:MAG TPA: hypothetical protein VFS24_08670 [Steroidobacteraceae bacterium]|nr:hypothetical protein [Steroidobacteraceae bacterium]